MSYGTNSLGKEFARLKRRGGFCPKAEKVKGSIAAPGVPACGKKRKTMQTNRGRSSVEVRNKCVKTSRRRI